MLSRETFAKRFGRRAVFGMVHLLPLPGAPLHGGSMDEVIEAAVRDARALDEGGCEGVVVENFGDRPFYATRVPPETIAAMARVVTEVARAVTLPIGVNVLRNDAHGALAIAAACGAAFIRVNVHVGAMVTDQGIIEGTAAETLRLRAVLAPGVAIFADHLVKHASPLGAADPGQMARDLRLRGLADAVIISGSETGAAVDPARLDLVRAATDAPLLLGSGLTVGNARSYPAADGAIVGTSLKAADGTIDPTRLTPLLRAFK